VEFFFPNEDEIREAEQRRILQTHDLNEDDTFTLYQILDLVGKGDHISHFFVGQLSYKLRVVNKLCTACGEKHGDLDHELAMLQKDNEEVIVKGFENAARDAEANFNKLFPDLVAEEYSGLTEEELLDKFNVNRRISRHAPGRVQCRTCSLLYGTMAIRMEHGLQCPNCVELNMVTSDEDNGDACEQTDH
jgi:phage FluMu protein Com